MQQIDLVQANEFLKDKTAFAILDWSYKKFSSEKIKLSTSFGAEGMVLLHMLKNSVKAPKVFTIDTGRNFQETYDLWDKVVKKYNIPIEVYCPEAEDLQNLLRTKSPNLFYENIENRKDCCFVRKIKPLKKALVDADVWISGIRRQQNDSRSDLEIVTYNQTHDVYKISPLFNWTESNVWEYIRNNGVPYNTLHDKGYPTVGCAPCSRPVRPAEGLRSGRWWWEKEENKECGIHIEDGIVKRDKPASNWNI